MPGVVGVFTAKDFQGVIKHERLPLAFPKNRIPENVLSTMMPFVLASTEASYVGEAIAVVVANSRYAAEDAAENVFVDYEPLVPVVNAQTALDASAPKSSIHATDNLITSFTVGYGDCDSAFHKAAHICKGTLFQRRGLSHPIEGRGILANMDSATGTLMVFASTQTAHELRNTIAEMLSIENDQVRVITPDVGGGFGGKFMVYPEDIVIPALAKVLGMPVKWTEDRREHFVSSIQERDQFWKLEIAADKEGLLLGIRGSMIHDQGAFTPHYITVPYNSASGVPGPYLLPAYHLEVDVVRTNKPPVIPVRGAGFQQATFAMERMLDLVSKQTGISRAEIRRRNLIQKSALPYYNGMVARSGAKVKYDTGDYIRSQELAFEKFGTNEWMSDKAKAFSEGKFIGIGFSHGLKSTGRGPFESATVRVHPTGIVSIYTGANAIGQGIATALCQICADVLEIDMDRIKVVCGDTSYISVGLGAYGSRQTMLAGAAVHGAANEIRNKAFEVARQVIGSEEELVYENGVIRTKLNGDQRITLGEISKLLAGVAGYAFPKGVEPGFEKTFHFMCDSLSYANGFHICTVEVDVFTGHVKINRYLALHDCGKLINPMIVEGQIHGAVAHGIGNALFEEMLYDDNGQPLTVTCADYILPTSTEVPHIETMFLESPTELNPMGAKGVGETGLIGVTSTIISAVEDALSYFDIQISESPITPIRILELLNSSSKYREYRLGRYQ
jgi:carbon-monoxide dehydrogenase large subunit